MEHWYLALIFGLIGLLIVIALGVPVAFSLGLVGFVGLVVFGGIDVASAFMTGTAYTLPGSAAFIPIPLFVLMAELLAVSGAIRRAYDDAAIIVGAQKGGLLFATIAAGAVLGACTGSSAASTAAIGRSGLHEMVVRGYSGRLAAGAIATVGGLAVIIPPSLTAIMYSFATEVPLLDLFAAGMIPGLLMALSYFVCTRIYLWRRPNAAPVEVGYRWGEKTKAALSLSPIFFIIVVVLGTMYTGVASVTESAGIGVVAALVVALFRHRLSLKGLFQALNRTLQTSAFIFLIIVCGYYFSQFWTFSGVTLKLAEFIATLDLPMMVVLILCNIVLLFLGAIMETASIILVVLPIFALAFAKLGADPIWIGTIFLINMEMALTTPPIGYNLFVLAPIAKQDGISFEEVTKGSGMFLLGTASVIGLVMAFPPLALWFVHLIK